jgi:hypothetical protein
MAAASDAQPRRDSAREHLERSRRLREDMLRSGNAVVYHLRRAAELRREAARNGR